MVLEAHFYLNAQVKKKNSIISGTEKPELKTAIKREMKIISSETCANVNRNFRQRVHVVISRNGRHLEHILQN